MDNANPPVGASLWEQSLLAMNDDAGLRLDRVVRIAGKLCTHNPRGEDKDRRKTPCQSQ